MREGGRERGREGGREGGRGGNKENKRRMGDYGKGRGGYYNTCRCSSTL